MRSLVVATLVLAAALAGCVEEPSTPPPPPPPPDEEEVQPENVTAPAFDVEVLEGRVPLSVGTPVASANPTPNEDFVKTAVAAANHTGIVVELAWTPKAATSESLQLLVEDFEQDPTLTAPLAQADGTGPLKIVLTPEQFPGGKLRMRVFATAKGGVAQDQPFTIYVSVFHHGTPEESYTAVPAST